MSGHVPTPRFRAVQRWGARHLLVLMLAGISAAELHAQQRAEAEEEILVLGLRERLELRAERTLDEEGVAAYGFGTIGELIDEITAEQGDTGDEPLFLVDGRRVSGLGAIEDYPPEAVERLDILPTGTATRLGASANRRVYNIVLKPQVQTLVGRAGLRVATEGAWAGSMADVSATHIRRPRRLNLTLRLSDEDALRESDRDVIQPSTLPADLGRTRSLRPSLDRVEVRLSAADRLAPWLDGSLTARLSRNRTVSLVGPGADGKALEQRARTRAASVDLQLNGEVGNWLLAFTGNYDRDGRRTATDRVAGEEPQQATRVQTVAHSRGAAAELVATGPVLAVPAGELYATFGAGFSRDRLCGSRRFDAVAARDCHSQSSRDLTAAVDVPIASRGAGVLAALGDLSAHAQLQRSRVTDLGTLVSSTFSLTWEPAEWMRLFGSVTMGRTPPAVGLLAEPPIETPGVRYFDPLFGESVDILRISGGNPDLGVQRGQNRRLQLVLKPLPRVALNLTGEYTAVRNRDVIAALPPASALLLIAFPGRFVRDPGGVLTQVDVRPVSFARQSQEQLRYAIDLRLPLGRASAGEERAASARPRLQLSAAHTIILDSELVIRPGFDPIDLLSREAVAFGGASRPRHELEVTLGYAERGLGVRLNGRYRSASYLNAMNGAAPDVLRFSPLATVDVRAFADGARLLPAAGWSSGTRLSLSVLNLTNDRQTVRDLRGATPLAYQPAYLDPVGRTIQIELRKSF